MTETEESFIIKMIDELRTIREKYRLPKGLLFSPDRLEIQLKRNSYDNFHLSYKEYFDFLPENILNLVIPISINMMVQGAGIPKERIERINKNGLDLEIDGNANMVTGVVLNELFLQKRFTDEEVEKIHSATKRNRKVLTTSSDLEFEWNKEIGERFQKNLIQVGKIFQTNPSIKLEMESVLKKHAESIKAARAKFKKRN